MEHIEQALKRARAERKSATAPSTEPDPLGRRTETRGSRQGARLPEAENLTRTKTRILELDPARLREQRIICDAEDDPALSAFNLLRTQVLQRLRANRWYMLGVTSPGEGNGKTLTAINLSIALARNANQRVLLADIDLWHPSVARFLFGEALPGISEYLSGEKEIDELLVNPGLERLVVLPGHRPVQYSSEALSSPKMVRLVEELKTRYRDGVVLFDLPPVLVSDDVIAFSPYLDAILVVVEEGRTETGELQRTYELLEDREILGTVLNKSADRSSRYGYAGYYQRQG